MIKYFFKKIYLFLFFQISYHLQKSTKLKQIKEIIALNQDEIKQLNELLDKLRG